jgi:hypothetical protein
MKTKEPSLRDQILNYWNGLESRHMPKDRKTLIRDMANHFDVSPQIIEREIGEWESGKGADKS